MTERDGVLVVVPTLGQRNDTLGPALASVRTQVGPPCTLVVVVPTEAREARHIAEQHGAVVVDDPRRGLSAAVNAAIAVADGEAYFAWIGDDDELRPQGLLTLSALLEANPRAVVAYGACEYMDNQDEVFAVNRAGRWATRVLRWGPDLIPQPASLTRLDDMRAVGPYDEALRFTMDLDMFLRLLRRGPFISTTRTVAVYRWHPDALTVANRDLSISEAEAVKRRHLARALRPLAPVWEGPVRWAVGLVSRRLSSRSSRVPA